MIKNKKNQVIAYTVNKAINSNLYISVENGEVMVKAPWYFSSQRIQRIVEEKRQWIINKIKENDGKIKSNNINNNKIIKILGTEYSLNIFYQNIEFPKLNIEGNILQIILPNKYKKIDSNTVIAELLEKMYEAVAQKELEDIMEKTRIKLGFAPEDYEIKKMKKLAKCTNDGIITINPKIITYSKEVIEYIVLHQFCHLKYTTHAKGFYKLLEKYMPNYKMYEIQIEENF